MLQETIITPARVPTPLSRAENSQQRALDSATVTHAATAVHGAYQGAMRSAWSAWKTVKQTYDGNLRDNNEGGGPASAAMTSRPSNSSRSSESVHQAGLYRQDGPVAPFRSQSPAVAAPSSMSASFTSLRSEQPPAAAVEKAAGVYTAPQPQPQPQTHVAAPQPQPLPQSKETHNPWRAAQNSDTDPFGIKTWS